jgi:integrase
VASVWIITRQATAGQKRYQIRYRIGGRESRTRYGGSFKTKREALARRTWITGELAAMRVPSFDLAEPDHATTLSDAAAAWQSSRVDVRDSTAVQHRTALRRVLPTLGTRPVNAITSAEIARLVAALHADGKARESIRKSLTALAMVFDYAGVSPNPARDRVQIRLPREERAEPEPPVADHVESAARLLTPSYRLALLVLDATGCRVNELERSTVGDLDEQRRGWLIRASVAKTKKPRWALLPDDLWQATLDGLPPREDRHAEMSLYPGVTQERLRMAIARACKAAGVPSFSPHDLRHRRISLSHKQGLSWAEIGGLVGQRNLSTTADTYTHVLGDYREVCRAALLESVR